MARKDFDSFIYSFLDRLTGSKQNSELYRGIFGKMSDGELKSFFNKCATGERRFTLTVPNYGDITITTKNNTKMAKEIGLEFYQHLTLKSDDPSVPDIITPNKWMVTTQQIGRVSQFVTTSGKMPEDSKHVDHLTKQPMGTSEGASITKDEIQILGGVGLDKTLIEVNKTRGGDVGAYNALGASLNATGEANLDTILEYATGVEAKSVTSVILAGMHIGSSL